MINLLKNTFGLGGVTHDNDFAQVLMQGIGGWQSRMWPAVDNDAFDNYCNCLTAPVPLQHTSKKWNEIAETLLRAGGYGRQINELKTPLLNFISYVNATAVQSCAAKNQTQDQCYTTHDQTYYHQDDITQTWRSWPYMICT